MKLAADSVRDNHGGPFGALVVQGDRVIGEGTNHVLSSNDPTAHAEVMAIRDACARVGTFALHGASLYATCEPCPMCLGAIYWARIERVYFASTREDAARIGFDDSRIYRELALPIGVRSVAMERVASDEADGLMDAWMSKGDRTLY